MSEDKKETPVKTKNPKDIRRMMSITEQSYNELLDYLATKPYKEVAPHIVALSKAIRTNVEVVPD